MHFAGSKAGLADARGDPGRVDRAGQVIDLCLFGRQIDPCGQHAGRLAEHALDRGRAGRAGHAGDVEIGPGRLDRVAGLADARDQSGHVGLRRVVVDAGALAGEFTCARTPGRG
jgi:hypothetical protein